MKSILLFHTRGWIKFLSCFLFVQLVFSSLTHAQPITLNTAGITGEYSSNVRITLLPGFNTKGPFRAFITGSLTVPLASTPSTDHNYVLSRIYKKPFQTVLTAPLVSEVSETIQYFDGLGRSEQTIQTKASPLGNDLVQPVVYDGLGREVIRYLPYAEQSGNGTFRTGALTTQGQFYGVSGWDSTVVKTSAPYSQTVLESSPLNRVLEQGAPGMVWQPASGLRDNTTGRTIVLNYAGNNSSASYPTDGYAVRFYTAIHGTGADCNRDLNSSGYYAAGELYLKITKNENWITTDGKLNTVEEYTDKQERLVLKRLFNFKDGNVETLSTYYVYDDLGNLSFVLPPGISPDGGSVDQTALDQFGYQYRYDGRKRLIEKRIAGKDWEYLVYNKLNQLVLSQDGVQRANGQWLFTRYDGTGRVVNNGIYASSALRTALETILNGETVFWESPLTTGNGYTTNAFPQSGTTDLGFQYYDGYTFPGAGTYAYSGSVKTQGLLTGSKTYILGTTDALLSINHYDEEGRIAKVFKQHYQSGAINSGNYDEISNTYNFEDALLTSTRIHHNTGTGNTTVVTHYDYDHVGRKLKSYEQINGETEVLLADNHYNETGQLKEKVQGGGKQTTSYRYNERGWLTKKTAPLFAMVLNYNAGSAPRYNGDVTSQFWSIPASTNNTFNYSYDVLGRLRSGDTGSGTYEKDIVYDVMGNITSLNRNGTGTQTYSYTGNRLNSVSGGVTRSYTYDANGNAITDGTNTFTYNILNLPATVSGGASLSYTYDAEGNKLKRIAGSTTTDYVDGIQYNAGAIDFIQTEEGLARKSTSGYVYEYTLTDHLGNNRLTFDVYGDNAREIQHDNYYPFGKTFDSYTTGTRNNYLYNGKELQDGLSQYDYGARFYDPVIGRWNVIDALAENHNSVTPYNYVLNNPINTIDPFGLDTVKANQVTAEVWHNFNTSNDNIALNEVSVTATRGAAKAQAAFISVQNEVQSNYRKQSGGLFMGYPDNLQNVAADVFYERYIAHNEINPFSGQGRVVGLEDANWIIDFAAGGIYSVTKTGAAILAGEGRLGSLFVGRSFSAYKAARGGTETLAEIQTSTGVQRISTEFHHAFITQRAQRAYGLPNFLVNNRINVWKLNTVQHSLIDTYRYQFLRASFKSEVGWFSKYNWFTKFN